MPEFSCPDCNEQFNSRQKRDEHMQAEHGETDQKKDPLGTRLKNAMTDRKKLAALVFGLTMIGLPFGGAVFYATVGPSTPGGSGSNTGNTYTSQPPVGYSIRKMPRPDGSPPQQAIVTQQLSDEMQVYLLLQGGPQQVGRRGLKPAVLLQYACTDCPQVRQTLTQVANDVNPRSGNWVYVAPYTSMNSTVAVSAFRQVKRYDKANRTAIKSTICQFLQNQPLACVADQLG